MELWSEQHKELPKPDRDKGGVKEPGQASGRRGKLGPPKAPPVISTTSLLFAGADSHTPSPFTPVRELGNWYRVC